MVVTGRHDAMVRPEDCGPLYDPVPLRVLEDCGHLSHEECPADLATMVADFVLAGAGGERGAIAHYLHVCNCAM